MKLQTYIISSIFLFLASVWADTADNVVNGNTLNVVGQVGKNMTGDLGDKISNNQCFQSLNLTSLLDPDNHDLGGPEGKSVIFMVAGFIFTVAGRKALHSILFVLGVGVAGYGAFWATGKFPGMVKDRELPVYVGVAVISLLGGFVAGWFLKLGVVILGAALGMSLSTIILSLNLFDAKDSATIIFIVAALTFAIVAYLFSDTIVIVATSIIGSLVFMFGLDYLTKKGFSKYVTSIRFDGKLAPPPDHLLPIIGSLGVIALVGIAIQYKSK